MDSENQLDKVMRILKESEDLDRELGLNNDQSQSALTPALVSDQADEQN